MLVLGVLLWSALLGAYSAQVESRLEQTAVANVETAAANMGTAAANMTLSRSERDLSWITSWLPWRHQEPGTTTEPPAVSSNDRKAKFLNIFTIVRFANEECRGDNNLNGTCVSPDECRSRGGQEAGKCANGYGVCCTMTGSCGNFTRYNNSYFESTDAGNTPNCQFTVYRDSSARICQLRLDFDTFRLAQPDNASGQCTTDAFSVSGVVNAVPVICGENSRTHMYIDVDPNSDRTVLQISTTQGSTQTTTLARDWKIKIQQIECNSTTRAYMKPYVVRVRFDDTEGQGETDNRGFSLNFIQKPCSVLGRRKRAALPWRMAPWGNGTVQGGRATWKTVY
ncbi:hypothetical protein FJT64_021208 [Amphibalanus amphitrite]|uniref:CUB domain-containing protein n=1 Tax=Amphibalanus amphitrite TaxID=1232801 RepID=A0A6A4WKT9_AMPAM|nr:hypothetical protein FJT64_021208 [Amphibalanus amphitrite]